MSDAEAQVLVQLILGLEPEAQQGITALVHLIHHKQNAADYESQARKLIAQAAVLTGAQAGSS